MTPTFSATKLKPNEWREWDWTDPGASVIDEPDGNYIKSIVDSTITSLYGFEINTPRPYDQIHVVVCESYCQYRNDPTKTPT